MPLIIGFLETRRIGRNESVILGAPDVFRHLRFITDARLLRILNMKAKVAKQAHSNYRVSLVRNIAVPALMQRDALDRRATGGGLAWEGSEFARNSEMQPLSDSPGTVVTAAGRQ